MLRLGHIDRRDGERELIIDSARSRLVSSVERRVAHFVTSSESQSGAISTVSSNLLILLSVMAGSLPKELSILPMCFNRMGYTDAASVKAKLLDDGVADTLVSVVATSIAAPAAGPVTIALGASRYSWPGIFHPSPCGA
jgi:hypothetical protein